MKRILKKALILISYSFIFITVLGLSALNKFMSILGPDLINAFALQGNMAQETLSEDELSREIIDVSYIKNNGIVETRQVIIFKPKNILGDLPLVFVPHYEINEKTADFVSYIRNGWAAASSYKVKSSYNGLLATDSLVFNNAALYTLRNLPGIDKQRIAIVGGSAGGYMTLMLNQLHMGTTASIANSPITNIYFNAHIYFPEVDKINRNSGLFDFLVPVQGMVSKSFQEINKIIKDDNDPRWEALSPISMAKAFSNPTVINHNTADILVPVDQVTSKYTYKNNDGTLPKGFNASLKNNFPGILSHTLEDLANPNEISVNKYVYQNNKVEGAMPYSDKLLSINIIDDGPISAKGSHASPKTSGAYDTFPYLKAMFEKSLKNTEKLVLEKLNIMLERYIGNSLQLIPHVGINESVYGSLSIYKKEIVQELSMWVSNNSLYELEDAMQTLISQNNNNQEYLEAWNEIKIQIISNN